MDKNDIDSRVRKNYLQIIDFLTRNGISENTVNFEPLTTILSDWDKYLMKQNMFEYVNNIHLIKFIPLAIKLDLISLNDIEAIEIPRYDCFINDDENGQYGIIGKVFDSTKYWNTLYFSDELLCEVIAYPDQRLLEIRLVRSIIAGKIDNNREKVDFLLVQQRCKHF